MTEAYYSTRKGAVIPKGADQWTRLHEARHAWQQKRWGLCAFIEDVEIPAMFSLLIGVLPTGWPLLIVAVAYAVLRIGVEVDAELYAMRNTPRSKRVRNVLSHVGL